MKRAILMVLTGATLAACAAPVPDSGRGVGYSDYSLYELERARREAELTGIGSPIAPAIVPPAGGLQPTAATPPSGIGRTDLAAAGIGPAVAPLPAAAPVTAAPLAAPGLDLNRTAGVQASPGNAAPVQIASTGISDEQNFDAVASRESIESDAQRRARQAAAYQVVQPTALPTRVGDGGPNIVQYALSAPNVRGQEWYSRSVLSGQGRFQRNCAAYRSPDEAQRDFLARGGPNSDSLGLDPDGDGFACGWDPAPFRAALAGN